jgi:hypothetical protein
MQQKVPLRNEEWAAVFPFRKEERKGTAFESPGNWVIR